MTVQFKPRTGGRGIEWCDETRNVTGRCMDDCLWEMPDGTRAVSYAEMLAVKGDAKAAYPHGFKHHHWWPQQLKDLTEGDNPRLIFCDSMSDLFAPAVPEDHVRQILEAMHTAPHHTYQSLTKAAPQLLKYLDDIPPNLWVGVSSPSDWIMGMRLDCGQQQAMLKRSLDVLRTVKRISGNIVWMSAEPVSWNLASVMSDDHPLDWIVIGAQSSGRYHFMPDPDHIRSMLQVLDRTKTPVFYKGNMRQSIEDNKGLGRWREDFPTHYRDGTPILAVARRQRECDKHGWTRIALPTVQP